MKEKAGLAVRLQKLREELGMMQQDLAKRIGVNRSTLASWETGHRKPELAHLEAIAEIGGVSIDWLLGRTDGNEADPSSVEDLVIIFHGKRQELPEQVLRLVKVLLEDEAAQRAKRAQAPGESKEANQ